MKTFFWAALIHVLYLTVGFLFLLPLWWALASSLRPLNDIFKYVSPFSFAALVPDKLTFEAYRSIFLEKGFGTAVFNSLFVAMATVLAGLGVNSLAGFAFAVLRFPGRNALFGITVLTFLVPFEAISIPLYTVVRSLGWLDTYLALIVPGVANGIVIFLFRQFFSQVPRELVDAARIDGASWLTIFVRIYLPLSKPVIISAALLIFLFQWEAFLWPLIVTTGKLDTLTINVALNTFRNANATQWGPIMAGSTLAVLPIIVVYLAAQRYFVEGIQLTGLGGR